MCVIIACHKNFPDMQTLQQAEEANSHGGGIAWIEGKKIKILKGLESKEINKLIMKGKVKLPCIIHFRIASIGDITNELTHPFPINETVDQSLKGSYDQVLFHNGTWNDWKEYMLKALVNRNNLKMPNGSWSDSRAMAFLAHIYGIGFLNLIAGFNKIAVLNNEGIIMYGDNWSKEDGIYYSNQHFKPFNYNKNDTNNTNYKGAQQSSSYNDEQKKKNLKSIDDEIDESFELPSEKADKYQEKLRKKWEKEDKQQEYINILNSPNPDLDKQELNSKYKILHSIYKTKEKRKEQLEHNLLMAKKPKTKTKLMNKINLVQLEIEELDTEIIEVIDEEANARENKAIYPMRKTGYQNYMNDYYDDYSKCGVM